MPIAIQNRVLLGITFFVGMMLLVGWIAINEPARMDVFTKQYQGRSIENGAVIFQNNCSTCHGMDGLGGQGPGIKNPMLFIDKNPASDVQNQIKDLQTQLSTTNAQIAAVADNTKTVTELTVKLNAETDATKKAAIQAQIDSANNALKRAQDNLAANQAKVASLNTQIDAANKQLDALIAQGWDPARPPRLKEVNWGGTLDAYITNAVAAGRPLSGSYWNGVIMPTWGQKYGGPLRDDEIADVTAYLLNWRDTALKTTPSQVRMQFKVPGAGGAAAANPNVKTVFQEFGKNADAKVDNLTDLDKGNATNGEKLYAANACYGCHFNASQGPATKGTWARVLTTRLKDPALTGLTGEQYIAQSILYPNHYIVPTYGAGVMPQGFGDQLSIQDVRDLIAYLKTFNTP
jgi:mono/diheme cytochrome c family protein